MRNDRDWVLWREYQSAWKRAEQLQSMWDGDSVLFGKYSGTEVKIEGEDYLIMREDDVLGIVG